MSGGSFTSGGSRPVDVEDIEDQLARIWKDATKSPAGGGGTVTRTCLLTLMVLTARGSGGRQIQEDVSSVFRARPCRVLLMELDPGTRGSSVSASISAHCIRPGGGQQQVCCEQVTLVCPAGASDHLPALARALSVSDLPVVLYLPGDPQAGADLLERLSTASDRVVYDSGGMAPDEARRLFARAAAGGRTAVADLEWGRTAPHRIAMAGLFDSPLLQPLLGEVASVSTWGGPGGSTGAALLHGWVRAALERPAMPADHRESGSSGHGHLRGLQLTTGDGSRMVVERGDNPEMVTARAEMPRACPLPSCRRHPVRSRAQLLCQELDRTGQDPVFARALQMSGPAGSPRGG